MPDLPMILSYYRALAMGYLTGALAGEAESLAGREHERVVRKFLSPVERSTKGFLHTRQAGARLRKRDARFRAWESANPDIVEHLRRKAERHAFDAV